MNGPGVERRSEFARARRGRIRSLVIMGVTAVAILAVAYVSNKPAGGSGFTSVVVSGSSSEPPPKIGKPAPNFTGMTIDGKRIGLRKLRGHPVWLTFGATWCQPCRAENPDIQAAYERYRAQGLVVLGVFIREDAATVEDYTTRIGLTYPKVADTTTNISSAYRILGIPSHFFIDSTGVLRVLKIGILDPPAIEAALAEIRDGVDRRT